MSKPVGIDIDGVLADFNTAYKRKIEARFPHIKCPDYDRACYPTEWAWERALGLTKDQEDEVWEKDILSSPTFWYMIPRYPWTREALDRASTSQVDVYFVTSRSGKRCKAQTEDWLASSSTENTWYPTVNVVTSHKKKIEVLDGLSVGFYIDDRLDTLKLIAKELPKLNLYCFDQPWNREDGPWTRITDLQSFLDDAEV